MLGLKGSCYATEWCGFIQEENRPWVKLHIVKISKLTNTKDGIVPGGELLVNRRMSNKIITISKPI